MQRLVLSIYQAGMKKIIVFTILVAGLILQGCTKCILPTCVQQKINQYKAEPDGMKSQVDEYIFQGKTVYVLMDNPRIADGGIDVIDANCNQLCFLGGIAGFTTCNGDNFFKKATFKKTIWKR